MGQVPKSRIRGKDSQVKVSKKRFLQGSQGTQNYMVVVPAGFASQGFSRFPRLHTLYRSPQTSQVRVLKYRFRQGSRGSQSYTGSHKSSKSRFPTKYIKGLPSTGSYKVSKVPMVAVPARFPSKGSTGLPRLPKLHCAGSHNNSE